MIALRGVIHVACFHHSCFSTGVWRCLYQTWVLGNTPLLLRGGGGDIERKRGGDFVRAIDRFDEVIERCRTLIHEYNDCKNADLIRAAIVFSVAGLDHYVKSAFVEALIPFLRNPTKTINANLDALLKDAGVDLMTIIRGFKRGGDEGIISVLLDRVQSEISKKTFQRAVSIADLFECYGLGTLIENAEKKTHKVLVDSVEMLVDRRNRIAHAADYEGGKLSDISIEETLDAISNLNEMIQSVDSILNSAIGDSGRKVNLVEINTGVPIAHFIDADRNFSVPRIRDIVNLFGVKVVARGFLMPGAVDLDTRAKVEIWWPKVASEPNYAGWMNEIDGEEIVEQNVVNDACNRRLVELHLSDPKKRIVFANIAGTKCDTGYCYRFVGVYELDMEETRARRVCVWKRISKT